MFSGTAEQEQPLEEKDELSYIFANSGKYQEEKSPLRIG
jgi:hypothetical protein